MRREEKGLVGVLDAWKAELGGVLSIGRALTPPWAHPEVVLFERLRVGGDAFRQFSHKLEEEEV